MTVMHVLNFLIPVLFMVFFGVFIDRLCKPGKSAQEESED